MVYPRSEEDMAVKIHGTPATGISTPGSEMIAGKTPTPIIVACHAPRSLPVSHILSYKVYPQPCFFPFSFLPPHGPLPYKRDPVMSTPVN